MGAPRSKPRRIVTRLLVFLLLLIEGAIVNVAVAWGCSQCGEFPPLAQRGFVMFPTIDDRLWWHREMANYPCIEAPHTLDEIDGPRTYRPGVVTRQAITTEEAFLVHVCAGWPALSIQGRACALLDSDDCQWRMSAMVRGAPIGIPWWTNNWPPRQNERVLPYLPIWPGFAINTIFYAAILWLLWTARLVPGAIRRMRRKQRGLCIRCAYDLRGAAADSPNCPECGEPLARLES